MTDTFRTTLANIKDQESILKERDERAVEIVAVLPLLRQVGWDTNNVSEIYPQRRLQDSSKVDYDLQIDGKSRIVIEVKWWGHTLDDEDEEQLANYCRSAKPKLAVLTSGRVWQLYLPLNEDRGAPLKKFHEFDTTSKQPAEVENAFGQFLSRASMVDFKPTRAAARKLYNESQKYERFKRAFTDAWNELTKNEGKDALTELVLEFAEKKGIRTSQENVTRFLDSLSEPLVNEATMGVKSHKKPASFRLPGSQTGKRKTTYTIEKRNGWNKFLLEVCELMQTRHRESFHQNILSMTDWFAESEDSQFSESVGDTGIYAKWGSSEEIKQACYEVVIKFGYPRNSLEIRDSKGAIL